MIPSAKRHPLSTATLPSRIPSTTEKARTPLPVPTLLPLAKKLIMTPQSPFKSLHRQSNASRPPRSSTSTFTSQHPSNNHPHHPLLSLRLPLLRPSPHLRLLLRSIPTRSFSSSIPRRSPRSNASGPCWPPCRTQVASALPPAE